jgi:undecaprenyl-diphosphatase
MTADSIHEGKEPAVLVSAEPGSPWTRAEQIGLMLAAGGALAFLVVASLLDLPAVQVLDETIIRAFRNPLNPSDPRGPEWLQEAARDYTALGGYAMLITLTTVVCVFLRLEQRRSRVRFILFTVCVGYLLSVLLKAIVDRPRPSIVPHLSHQDSPSFPSGHSMMSAIVYLTLGLMLAELAIKKRVKLFLVISPLLIAALVAVSRVMMGVHYPTDVFAGWCAGLSWAMTCWLVVRRRRAHRVSRLSHQKPEGDSSFDAPVELARDTL